MIRRITVLAAALALVSCGSSRQGYVGRELEQDTSWQNMGLLRPEGQRRIANEEEWASPLGHGYEFDGNGKSPDALPLEAVFSADTLPQALCDFLGSLRGTGEAKALANAVAQQQAYLARIAPRNHQLANLAMSHQELEATAKALATWLEDPVQDFCSLFTMHQVWGEDKRGHVHYTGYFTPVLKARRQPEGAYQFPLYRSPTWNGPRLDRQAIDQGGGLQGRGLEIGYTADLLNNYFLQVQGSGYLSFPDGSLQLLAFDGGNGYAYTSIGKYFVAHDYIAEEDISLESIRAWFKAHPDSLHLLNMNRSYAFFRTIDQAPRGGANVPLTAGHSMAADTRYLPYGGLVLAMLPVLNAQGQFKRHTFRLMAVQDRGGAIKGPGHVDVYYGVGQEALKQANALHHYGNLWLLKAKSPH